MARCNYLGWLLILWAILACLVSASGAHAQSGSADDAKRNRYVPIPLRGDIESLLRDRLRLAQENDTLKKFLADLLNRHAEFGLEPGKLDKLDIDNATFRSVLKEAMKRKADGAEFSLKDLQELQEKLQKLVAGGSGGTQGATPMRGAQGRRAGPAPASTSTGDNLARLAETWLRRTDRQALGGLLQESAAFRKGLEDLRALADGTEGRSWGALESLPDYLRFSEKWNHEWADKFIGGVRENRIWRRQRSQRPPPQLERAARCRRRPGDSLDRGHRHRPDRLLAASAWLTLGQGASGNCCFEALAGRSAASRHAQRAGASLRFFGPAAPGGYGQTLESPRRGPAPLRPTSRRELPPSHFVPCRSLRTGPLHDGGRRTFGSGPGVGPARSLPARRGEAMTAPLWRARAVLASAILFVMALPAFCQDNKDLIQEKKEVVTVPAHGFQVLGHLLDHFDLQPLESITSLDQVKPAETWIIALGELKLDELHAMFDGGLPTFLKNGGALLIASAAPASLRPWNLEIPGWKLQQDLDSAYREIADCPMIVEGIKTAHPLFKGLKRGIATNRPSLLRSRGASLPLLAQFSADTRLAPPPALFGLPIKVRRPYQFLCGSPGDSPAAGRMAVLSDDGVFINSMLLGHDSENFEFTLNAIAWFRDGPQGKRRYALLLENGQPVKDFTLPLHIDMPGLPPEQVLAIISRRLAEMDRENFFNHLLLKGLGRENVWRGIMLALAGILTFLLIRRFVLARYRLETWVPLVVGRHASRSPALPLEWQRHEALQKLNNYVEPAQVLARQFFQEHFEVTPQSYKSESRPRKMIAPGNWLARWRLRRQMSALWRNAGRPPKRVSRRRFVAMAKTIDELDDLLKSGQARLADT
ncbi:MAG: hypothetical protein HY040_05970 [Planctomycetes bacterium]|nr:hypothetical protein [Planctomycetota bacterium]